MKSLTQHVKTGLSGIRYKSCTDQIKLIKGFQFLGILAILSNCISAQEVGGSFDWDGYETWGNTTQYTRTYIVNQRHPNASDDHPGTSDKPLETINAAAQLVMAGERVLIYAGIYRELIEPKNEGTGPGKMISYESAPGEQVIIRGSRILDTDWIQRRVLTDVLPDTSLTYTWSRRIWVTTLPDELFINDYYPFRLPNILPEEHQLMPWARLVKNLAPYTSSRGLIFQNGQRMVQLEDHNDLARVPGSFWVDKDGKTIHIHAYGSGNPNNDLFEIGVQSHLLRPQKIGTGYIQLRGLIFEHCANGFLRTSTGAVTTMGGHHWIIEDNIIRHINSSGLEFGYYAFEFRDPDPRNIQPRTDEDTGGVIVRNNQIYSCGTAGIRSYSVKNGIVENNHIWDCGWQDAENYWECSGIKILRARNTLVRGNHIHHIQGGNGIWLDWDIQYSRVTANIIHDIQNIQGGIFVEASQTPNLVDNNFLWNIDGNGIYGNDSDELMVYHNLIANTTGPVVHAVVATRRRLNDRWLTSGRNRVFNNIFINGGQAIVLTGEDNLADFNLYISTREPTRLDLEAVQKSGMDKNSSFMRACAGFMPEPLYFTWNAAESIPEVPLLDEVKYDWNNHPRKGINTIPGPFARMPQHLKLILNEKSNQY